MRVKMVVFISTLLLLLIGCNNQETITEDLPKNLIIEIDQTEESVTSAPILTVEFIQIDEDIALKTFFKDEVADEESNAYGRAFFSDETEKKFESLYVYGDKDTAIRGGLGYSKSEGLSINYGDVVSIYPDSPDRVTQENQTFNHNYSSFTDLSFKPYQQVTEEIINKLDLVGIEEVELEVVYALDQETMNDHLTRNRAIDSETMDISEEDEAYLLHFRQMFHKIPVANFTWQSSARGVNDSTETVISAIYNEDGIYNLDVKEYYALIDEGEAQPLLNQTDALSEVIKLYQNKIISSKVLIDQAELNYIGKMDGSERQLIPAWIFRTVSEIDESAESITYRDYQFIVIDAITGDEIKR